MLGFMSISILVHDGCMNADYGYVLWMIGGWITWSSNMVYYADCLVYYVFTLIKLRLCII